MSERLVYFDSGTTNSRIYLLDGAFRILYTAKLPVGSRDSAAVGDNRVLIEALFMLYQDMLKATGASEDSLGPVFYASGMVTSPYGLREVPHLLIPAGGADFARALAPYREDTLFRRDFLLIPGLRTGGDDIAHINNMRGEEIEILGAMDAVADRFPGRRVALILPGSHTHAALIEDGCVRDILSSMTGELFHAVRTDTILAPLLSIPDRSLDAQMVREGMRNLDLYGFNRAIYICHAMRLFNRNTPVQRKSYCEGVLNGGFARALAHACGESWRGCDAAMVVSDDYMAALYAALLADHPFIREVAHLRIGREESFAVKGLKKILACKGGA